MRLRGTAQRPWNRHYGHHLPNQVEFGIVAPSARKSRSAMDDSQGYVVQSTDSGTEGHGPGQRARSRSVTAYSPTLPGQSASCTSYFQLGSDYT